jgi:hypothetical protein
MKMARLIFSIVILVLSTLKVSESQHFNASVNQSQAAYQYMIAAE